MSYDTTRTGLTRRTARALPRIPRISRLSAVCGLAAGGVVLCAAPAFAHIGVDPEEAAKGDYATVNFKVPNERDNASTTKVEVTLPTDHPLASAMPQPVPGWDVEVTKDKLDKPIELHGEKINEAVTKITWTGGEIEPGQFQQFPVSIGQLPEDADRLVFKALQTYDNKEVVRWIEVPEEGAPEPESPAPVLKLTDAPDGSHDDGREGDHASAAAADGSDLTARLLGGTGIIVGIIGVGFGVFAGRRRSA